MFREVAFEDAEAASIAQSEADWLLRAPRSARRRSAPKNSAAESIDDAARSRQGQGGIHPVIRTWQRVEEILARSVSTSPMAPEIEADWFNFTALNNPPNHPARSRCRTRSTST